ncbi:biotin--[acetyl-CoA-carboxylase] ligase [Trueperella bialowiezensis]|uniref:Bifunctional protein BirA n=1 Tax=Trueperella bialowiezensis TaxID=312285 RepID=A0A448PG97_9ACTO|nr:biotin--[acetyl-CoA-carboxylase] ligase [Trueperella bialowiezensis]VEI13914.1 Bifunctional protein BirA [Trueperella bialowiezensis]
MAKPLADSCAKHARYTVHRVETTTSTQDAVRALTDAAHLTTVVADRQTAGRGRLGRIWESPARQSLLASTFLTLPDTPLMRDRIGFLTLISAAAMRAALAKLTGFSIEVKFPNDLVISTGGAPGKIAGVLGEFLPEHTSERGELCAVVGVGVNIYQQQGVLPAGGTSLALVTNASTENTMLAAAEAQSAPQSVIDALLDCYLTELDERVSAFATAGNRAPVIAEINEHLYGKGAEMTVAGHTGILTGLTPEADLLLEGETPARISPGDVAMFADDDTHPAAPAAKAAHVLTQATTNKKDDQP